MNKYTYNIPYYCNAEGIIIIKSDKELTDDELSDMIYSQGEGDYELLEENDMIIELDNKGVEEDE